MEQKTIGTDVNQVEITSLKHIHGQPAVRDVLRISIDAFFANRANNPNSSFGPVLLSGPPGVGKTLTARAIHHELGNLKLYDVNGEFLRNSIELTSILIGADENTTLFVDEGQALDSRTQHALLTAISSKTILVPRRTSTGRPYSIPLPNFCLILAATHEHQLQAALRNRMRIHARFDYYSVEDLVGIIKQRMQALKWKYECEEVLYECSRRSKQTPRLAINRNLQMAHDLCACEGRDIITVDDVERACYLLRIDSLGLDILEQSYLRELDKRKSIKLNVIASKLGLPQQTITSVIEPYLLRAELIEKKGFERVITERGKEHVRKNAEQS